MKSFSRKTIFRLIWYLCWNMALLGVFAVIHYLVAETAMHTGCEFLTIVKFKIFLNLLVYGVAELFFLALTLSFPGAILGGAFFTALFSGVNIYLIEYTSIPLYVTDLTNVGTAANVVTNYKLSLLPGIRVLLVYLAAVLALFFVMRRFCKPPVKKGKWYKRLLLRLLGLVLVFLIGRSVVSYIVNADKVRRYRVSISTFRPIKSYRNSGGLLTFVRSAKLLKIEEPEGYSVEEAQAILDAYPSDAAGEEGFNRPNVIVIMNEAFADLQSVGTFETNEPVLPFFNSLEENTVKGRLYVSIFGGHTANSEYEFLSGDSCAFLPSGTTAFQVYIKNMFPGLTRNLMLDDYQGLLAMHPYLANGYNRFRVYPYMYFSRFITQDDFVDPKLVRGYISDEADFDRIISEYEEAKAASDEPFYMFNVTMQNHSGYLGHFDNLPETISITTPGIEFEDAERYLNLVHLSDMALEGLIDYFSAQDDPTIIVMFGDHEPGLDNNFYTAIMGKDRDSMSKEEQMELYWTPFMIWANYDIEEKQDVRTSANYLQTLLLETAGMKMSGYNKFLAEQMEDIPVMTGMGYWGADGTFYSATDEKSPYYEQVQRYHMLCYNHLFDIKNRLSGFELLAQ